MTLWTSFTTNGLYQLRCLVSDAGKGWRHRDPHTTRARNRRQLDGCLGAWPLVGQGVVFVDDGFRFVWGSKQRRPPTPPSVTLPPPSVTLPPPSVTLPTPSVTLPPPSVTLPPPSVTLPPPSVTLPPPSVTLPPPSVTLPPPSVTLPPPSVTLPPPSVTLPPPSVTLPPPSGTLPPPSVTLPPPSATLQPPSATLQPPSGTLPPPSVTLQPLSVSLHRRRLGTNRHCCPSIAVQSNKLATRRSELFRFLILVERRPVVSNVYIYPPLQPAAEAVVGGWATVRPPEA